MFSEILSYKELSIMTPISKTMYFIGVLVNSSIMHFCRLDSSVTSLL